MKRNGWSQKECEKLIRRYIDETGKLDYDPHDIARWAKEERHYTMPEPPTDLELLTMFLQEASGKARRRDETTLIQYRSNLAYPAMVNGERRMRWCDADGPTTDTPKVLASAHQRKEQAINILAGAMATILHHQRTHPTEQIEMFDLSVSMEEIQWRVFGRTLADDDQKKAG
jgi:hypothetical protein